MSLGPFPAPDRLKFAVRGHTGAADNKVYLELEILKIRIPLTIADSGPQWTIVDCELPLGWRGRLITLNASVGPDGGLSLSQPFGPGTGETRQYGLMETVTSWLANGLLYGAVFVTFARLFARREYVKPCWVPLAACAALAVLGYIAFWAYFASPTLGKLFSAGIFLTTLLVNLLRNGRFDLRDREWLSIGCAAMLIGFFYVGILHLYPVHRDFYDLASNRFIPGLSGDNRLPFDFADLIYHGQRPKELGAGWLSSDRPPLQEGWQLLGWPATEAWGFSDQTASGTASIWLQLSWVFALYGLLRSMGMPRPRAIFWITAASLNGFFLVHTVFTWPKLAAGAFVCGTFGMWVLNGSQDRIRGRLLGALFAGLACLAHGGAAFTLIPFIPWVAWRSLKGEAVPWTLAALVFALVLAPWLAYQKFYAPPGNRLLKWHLAGQVEVDDRPLWRTIADAYRPLSLKQVSDRTGSNLAFQWGGDWSDSAGWSTRSAKGRRSDEYDHMFRALGWWNLALPLSAIAFFRIFLRRPLYEISRRQRMLGAWIVSSLLIWCVLMFSGTEIPLGSFAVMIAIFTIFACCLEVAGPWCLPCLGALQGSTLASTWMPTNSVVNGQPSAAAIATIGLAVAMSAALALRLDPISEAKTVDGAAARNRLPETRAGGPQMPPAKNMGSGCQLARSSSPPVKI